MRSFLLCSVLLLAGCTGEIDASSHASGGSHAASGGKGGAVSSGGTTGKGGTGGSVSKGGSGGTGGSATGGTESGGSAGTPSSGGGSGGSAGDVSWTGPAGSDVWKMAGVFVYDPKTFPADAFAQVVKQNHFGWVMLQVVDGSTEKWPCTAEPCGTDTAEGFIRSWRPWLKYVGAWGVNRANASQADVEAEAQVALDTLAKYDAAKAYVDFYVTDAEAEYEYSKCGACVNASGWWAGKFRSGRPAGSFEAAVSSYGRTDLSDVYWMSWRDQGFHFLPQAYWNDPNMSTTFKPSACVDVARVCPGSSLATQKGLNCTGSPTDCPCWSLDQIHPSIGYGWGQNPPTADDYVADLGAAHAIGSVGFSIFEGQYVPAASDAWAKFGAAIVNDGIAITP